MKRMTTSALLLSMLLCPIWTQSNDNDNEEVSRKGCNSWPKSVPCLNIGALTVGTINGEKFCGSKGLSSGSFFFLYDTTSQQYNPEVATRALESEDGTLHRQPPPPPAPTEFQNITFNTNGKIKGWSHDLGSSSITCNCSGLYLLGFTANFGVPETRSISRDLHAELELRQQPPGGGALASVIVTLNDIEIPGSQAATPVQADTFGDLAKVVLFCAEKGDVLRLKFIIEADTPTNWGLVASEGESTLGIEPSISAALIRVG